MLLRVECYAGYKGDERPVSFYLGETLYQVTELQDTWYGPEATFFRVQASDGHIYILRHDGAKDDWTLESFRRTK